MVENNIFQSYGQALEIINKANSGKKSFETVELFFSFDIVNSTQYKDTRIGWQIVLPAVLNAVMNLVTKDILQSQLWRVLGDEIIFFVTIRDTEEIYSAIDAIYSILVQINNILKNEKFFENLEGGFSKEQIVWMKTSNILAVQSAAWIAIVNDDGTSLYSPYGNIFKKYTINDNQQINEFLGQDIDTGFRLKKETQSRRLVISVELARILSDKTDYLSRLNIITYKVLKGVWQNHLYPIIWYHDPKISGVSFESSFYYDETSYSQLSKEYFLNRENNDGNLTSYMFTDTYKALEKVITDQNIAEKIKQIYRVISDTKSDVKAVEDEFDNRLLEFHCAAVCCDVKSKQVLIAKRKNRNLLSGCWEFGCAKATIDKKLIESIKEDYKNDFGIDITVICDKVRSDSEPKPIALYQVTKVDRLQKGVIVAAKVDNIEKLDDTVKCSRKHEEYRWISEQEIDSFHEETVDDFKDTLKKIFLMWDELFSEE